MKKQKGKGQKAGASKKKDETLGTKEEASAPSAVEQEDKTPEHPPLAYSEDKDEAPAEKPSADEPETTAKPDHHHQPSLSLQSKLRSSSFRRSSVSQGPLSPNGTKSPELPVLSPDGDSVNSIYRKQAARLDELEKENRRLAKDTQEAEKRCRHTEEELEELREASGEVAELKSRAQKADAQIEEFNKLVRLNIHDYFDWDMKLTVLAETRKHLTPTPKLPTAISILKTSRLLSQPSYQFLQSLIVPPSSTRFQKLHHRIYGNGNL